jgi:hypothetical protein
VQHPLAAQAAFSALLAEGRCFAGTPEGAAWKAALAGSDMVRHGRPLWEALSLNSLEEEPSAVVPSSYLEAIYRAVSFTGLEGLIRQLWSTEREGHHDAA